MKKVNDVLGREHNLSDYNYFVTMTDKFLSGWGEAANKIAKRVVLCRTWKEARIIVDGILNCKDQNGMRYINIASEFPRYNDDRYTVSVVLFDDCALYIEKSNIK